MDEVLDDMTMFYSWDQIMERYNTLQAQCFAANVQMDLNAVHQFSQLFKFRGDKIEECKTELAHYVEKYSCFHASTLEGVFHLLLTS